MRKRRIVIAAGGTGGHLYPAQALAEQLKRSSPDTEILFMGSGISQTAFFDRERFTFQEVASATLQRKGFKQSFQALLKLGKGMWDSWKHLRSFKPDLVVGFGGYPSLPVLLSALMRRLPVLLHEGNAYPGKVVRLLSPYVKMTGVHLPPAEKWLKGRTLGATLPLREGFTSLFADPVAARRFFGLDPHKFTFLVFGGSQGALSINTLFSAAAAYHLAARTQNFQVIHLTGDPSLAQQIQDLYLEVGISAAVRPFESRMDMAWSAADLAICRAGASTLAELLEFEVPALLLPFPQASDRHQFFNAHFMAQEVKGAINLGDEGVTVESMVKAIWELLADDRAKLDALRAALKQHKQKQRPRELCALVQEMAEVYRK